MLCYARRLKGEAMSYRHRKIKPVSRMETIIVPVPAPERVRSLNTLKAIDLIEFNQCAEQEFVKVVTELCAGGSPSVRECQAEAAFELNISIETAKRYLLKHTAHHAEFKVENGKVGLR